MEPTSLPLIPLSMFAIGCLVAAIFGLVLLIKAFKESVGWGFIVLLIPILGLIIFIAKNWSVAGKSFLAWLVSGIVACVGLVMAAKKVDPEELEKQLKEASEQTQQAEPE